MRPSRFWMTRFIRAGATAAFLHAVIVLATPAAIAQDSFQFGVISHAFGANAGQATLRAALIESDADNLAFVVVNGIKSASEPCSDALYSARHDLLEEAENGIIITLAASDWMMCRNRNGSLAGDRLNRLRELFFSEEFSFGASKLPLLRQSLTPKFRSYAENARWEFGKVLFATINLPSPNNHFVLDGGRNSEFEDRLIANKDWLQRLFLLATQKKLTGVVLFADGNPLALSSQRSFLHGQRDGFAETRQRITTLAAQFHGKVLLIHGANPQSASQASIVWHGNLGSIAVVPGWSKFAIGDNDAWIKLVHSSQATAPPSTLAQ